MNNEDLITKHLAALQEMSDAGYALIIFTPDEIAENIDPSDLEHFLVGAGQNWMAMQY